LFIAYLGAVEPGIEAAFSDGDRYLQVWACTSGVAAGLNGDIYVSDLSGDRVQVFSSSTFILDDSAPDDGDIVMNVRAFSPLVAGTYTFTEKVWSAWVLNGIACDNGGWNVNGPSVGVTVAPAEVVNCTFSNLSAETPATITDLDAGISGSDVVLTWSAPEAPSTIDYYGVYRGTSPYFTPTPGAFYDTTSDTTYTDTGAAGDPTPYYYIVVGVSTGGVRGFDSNRVGKILFGLVP